MVNLTERREHWNDPATRGPATGHDLHDSIPYPFEPELAYIFKDADVLEIGPGNGRQYERVKSLANSYSICDIAPSVIADPIFDCEKFLLTSWQQDLGKRFDAVHFWYVLHHIRLTEMKEFFAFVYRHLRPSGVAAFNCAQPINATTFDGIGTTYAEPSTIDKAAAPLHLDTWLYIGDKSTEYVFLYRRLCETT